jgi:hypothetical protein
MDSFTFIIIIIIIISISISIIIIIIIIIIIKCWGEQGLFGNIIKVIKFPQSSSTLWNYSKCGVYTVESEAGC